MSEAEIRRLSAGDAALFAQVADDVFDAPVDPARLAAYLSEPGHHMLVAIDGGVVVGQTARWCIAVPQGRPVLYDEVAWRRVTGGASRGGCLRRCSATARRSAARRPVGTEPDWPARGLYEQRRRPATPVRNHS